MSRGTLRGAGVLEAHVLAHEKIILPSKVNHQNHRNLRNRVLMVSMVRFGDFGRCFLSHSKSPSLSRLFLATPFLQVGDPYNDGRSNEKTSHPLHPLIRRLPRSGYHADRDDQKNQAENAFAHGVSD